MINLINFWFIANAAASAVWLFFLLLLWLSDQRFKFGVAIWIWQHIACGVMPFYDSPKLSQFCAPIAPNPADWRGLKLRIWNRAVAYLLRVGYLTTTPTLKEKF